LNIYVVDHDA